MNLLSKIKTFLYKVFWIDEFEGKSKFLLLVGKFFMYAYVISVLSSLVSVIGSFDIAYLIFTVAIIFIFPLGYRIIMGLQRFIHKF